jgi:hypothetical protein
MRLIRERGDPREHRALIVPTIGDYSFAVRLQYRNVGTDVVFAQDASTVMQLAIASSTAIRPSQLHLLATVARQRITGG